MHDATTQSLQPQVEKMEAAWARLHTITGAETPEEVIAYFEGKPCQRILCPQPFIILELVHDVQTSCFCGLPLEISDCGCWKILPQSRP